MNPTMLEIFDNANFVVLDTETTGLTRPCEIIDIAILDARGETMFNSLLKPKEAISGFITGLTGITNDMVVDSPSWVDVKPTIINYLRGRVVITYNAKFDRHMMHCSDDMWGLDKTDYHDNMEWVCAMEAYAPIHGVWNDFYNSWKWCKLTDAMSEQGLPTIDAHRALADTLMTYRLLRYMCEKQRSKNVDSLSIDDQ